MGYFRPAPKRRSRNFGRWPSSGKAASALRSDWFEGAIYVAVATCSGEVETTVAIMFVRAQVIGRGAGRSVVSAAAYRHRARMMDEQAG
ncbi:hypothetical protein GFM09_37405, partial [Rhizobium leguminosarum bv. viciae]